MDDRGVELIGVVGADRDFQHGCYRRRRLVGIRGQPLLFWFWRYRGNGERSPFLEWAASTLIECFATPVSKSICVDPWHVTV